MTTNLRTLMLLGFTALAGLASGCIVETTNGSGSGSCASKQYFNVQWEVDTGLGTAPLACAQTPDSSVVLQTNAGDYDVGRTCQDGTRYNWTGSSNNVAAGTAVFRAQLVSTVDGRELAFADVPPTLQVAVPACTPVQLTFEFPLAP